MTMRILVTGSTGLVGQRVMEAARAKGHEPLGASRSGNADLHWPGGELPQVDAIIHLAGASIGGKRWNKTYQAEILRSRVETTKALREALPGAHLVCANAVGYYGMDPVGECGPDALPGNDFLADVCVQWQKVAGPDATIVRLGHVLAKGEGILARLEPLHRMRVAGIPGNGSQGLPWIMADALAAQLVDLAEKKQTGIVHGVQGNMQYRELHELLCEHIGGCKRLKIPTPALRLALGGFAPYLLTGQTVRPDPDLPRLSLQEALGQLYS